QPVSQRHLPVAGPVLALPRASPISEIASNVGGGADENSPPLRQATNNFTGRSQPVHRAVTSRHRGARRAQRVHHASKRPKSGLRGNRREQDANPEIRLAKPEDALP